MGKGHAWRAVRDRFALPAALAAALLMLLLAVFRSAQNIGQPFPGFLIIREANGRQWSVWDSTPSWWPGLQNTGLNYRDEIIQIADTRLAPGVNYHALFHSAYRQGQDSIPIGIRRNGQTIALKAPLTPFTPAMIVDSYLPSVLTALCIWMLSVAVYRAQPAAALNRAAAMVGALMTIVIGVFFPGLDFDSADPLARLLDLSWVVSVTLVGGWTFDAIMRFTTPAAQLAGSRAYRAARMVVWAVCLLGLLSYLIAKLRWWVFGWSPLAALFDEAGLRFSEVTVFGTGAFAMLRTAWAAWRGDGQRLRRQSRILLLGFLAASPMIATLLYGNHAPARQFVESFDLRYLYLSVPLALAFAILRYQMFRVAHGLFLLPLALAGGALIASIGHWLVQRHAWPVPLVILLAVLAAGSFTALLPRALSRLLNWEGQSYQAVKRFAGRVMRCADLDRLPGEIAGALAVELQVERAAVWLMDADAALTLAGQAAPAELTGVAEGPPLPPRLIPPAEAWQTFAAPIWLDSRERPPAWLAALRRAGLVIAAPLLAQGQTLGLLGLGMRWDEEVFQSRDLEIVELIAQQASLALLNARHIAELRQVPRRVAEAQERERFTIAQELHDTVQQFLGRLPFHLELSRRALVSDAPAADARLQRCIADVESAARTLRQIRSNLAPTQLTNGLAQPLRDLAERFRVRTGLRVHIEIDPAADGRLDPDARHALYRIAQQALDNVEAHAQAANVFVTLAPADDAAHASAGGVRLVIADDGRGFTAEEQERAVREGHFGLLSMRARVEPFDGVCNVRSTPGQGTHVVVWLPARPATREQTIHPAQVAQG